MNIYYKGTDITDDCDVVACRHTDTVGQCDFLEMEMEHAPVWNQWNPEADDEIRIEKDGYSTGKLYLAGVLPEEGRYRLWAASMPLAARARKYESFEKKTLSQIMNACAAGCGMKGKLYGLSGAAKYEYLIRENETAPAFISRILDREGAYLKALDGAVVGITLQYCSSLKPVCEITIEQDAQGVDYQRRDEKRLSGIDVATIYASGSATDAEGKGGRILLCSLPARENDEAKRWAKGLLTCKNALCETLAIEMEFHPGMTAMSRVTVNADGRMAGDWVIKTAEHEFIRKTTRVEMVRVPGSVG